MSDLSQPRPQLEVAQTDHASRLFGIVKEIHAAVKASDLAVSEIEKRGYLKNLFSSGRDDLVSTAKSQNRINELVVKLQQEAIALNTMGYAYLTSVIAEFERQVNEGVTDSDGRIHVLSANGKKVARMATEMFNAILDGSRSTQEKIEANSEAVANIRFDIDHLVQSTEQHAKLLDGLTQFRDAQTVLVQEHRNAVVRQGEELELLTNTVTQVARSANDRLGIHSSAIQGLQSANESLVSSSNSHAERARQLELVAEDTAVRLAGQSALSERQGESIAQLRESVKTLLRHQSESDDRLSSMAHESTELGKSTAALRAEVDRLGSLQAAADRRLQLVLWTMTPALGLLALCCVALAVRFWHLA